MFETAAVLILLSVFISGARMLKGPTVFDRILAANLIGTKAIIIILLLGYIYGRPHFSDLALVYALINFIVTIALLRFMERGRLD